MEFMEFEYPNDEPKRADPMEANKEFVNKLVNHILTRKNPIAALVGMAIACGFDLSYIYNCKNTITAISEKLHMRQQCLSNHVIEARKLFHFRAPLNCGRQMKKEIQLNTFPRYVELIQKELNQMTDTDRRKAVTYIKSKLL